MLCWLVNGLLGSARPSSVLELPGFLLDISCLSSVSSTHPPTEPPVATQKLVLYHVHLTHALNSMTKKSKSH